MPTSIPIKKLFIAFYFRFAEEVAHDNHYQKAPHEKSCHTISFLDCTI